MKLQQHTLLVGVPQLVLVGKVKLPPAMLSVATLRPKPLLGCTIHVAKRGGNAKPNRTSQQLRPRVSCVTATCFFTTSLHIHLGMRLVTVGCSLMAILKIFPVSENELVQEVSLLRRETDTLSNVKTLRSQGASLPHP